jgi:hypothetical protein
VAKPIDDSAVVVTFDEEKLTCTRPDGLVEEVRWDDLRAVLVETNDLGPFASDVFWILVGTASGVVVPLGASGEEAMLARLQELPGFDNQLVIAAMTSTENQRFRCWERVSE